MHYVMMEKVILNMKVRATCVADSELSAIKRIQHDDECWRHADILVSKTHLCDKPRFRVFVMENT